MADLSVTQPLRARDLGLIFNGVTGARNGITDVPGVTVGMTTVVSGDSVRTGVTAVLPLGAEQVGVAVAAGLHSQNGNGELTGAHWINESGSLNTPLLLTNTHAVGTVHRAVIEWVARHHGDAAAQWLLPVVAETWDGYLNDINGDHVHGSHVWAALDTASVDGVVEGSAGGGTGMNCYGFKGGNGTSSRRVAFAGSDYHVGVFLQTNFGDRAELSYRGLPIGKRMETPCPIETDDWFARDRHFAGAGSCIGVVATDAPLLPDQLRALARRVTNGLARTGTSGSHFSGDIFLAFSTANAGALDSTFPNGSEGLHALAFVPWGCIDPFFDAVVDATEEAVWNSLVVNETADGRAGHRSYALDRDALRMLITTGDVTK
jgi:L-aminopeptidase/D-esterase-like protein